MVRSTVTRLFVVVAAGALVLSGCGDSSGGSGTSGSGGRDTDARTSTKSSLTGTPIVIGGIGSKSGVLASIYAQGFTVAPAWADWVNANGGINGHPVKVELADDGFDPAKAQAAAKDLLDNKGSDALLVMSDQMLPSYATDAVSKGIPVMGGEPFSSVWYKQAGLYSTATDVASTLTAVVQVARNYAHATHLGWMYCLELAACNEATPGVKAAAEKAGLGFTSVGASQTAPDYTAECLKLKQENVNFVFAAFNAATFAKIVQDCQSQGFNPTWGAAASLVGPDILGLKNFTAYGPAYSFPTEADAPAVQTFTAAMEKYAKGNNWHDGSASATWSALEMLRKAMETITGEVTPKSVTAALNTIKGENLGGLLANKVSYTGQPLAYGSRPCYFVSAVKDGKTEAPAGLAPQCPS